jgi:hypothetical protein
VKPAVLRAAISGMALQRTRKPARVE